MPEIGGIGDMEELGTVPNFSLQKSFLIFFKLSNIIPIYIEFNWNWKQNDLDSA